MHPVYKFMLWFITSFVAYIFISDLVPNKVILAFVVAVTIGLVEIKHD